MTLALLAMTISVRAKKSDGRSLGFTFSECVGQRSKANRQCDLSGEELIYRSSSVHFELIQRTEARQFHLGERDQGADVIIRCHAALSTPVRRHSYRNSLGSLEARYG